MGQEIHKPHGERDRTRLYVRREMMGGKPEVEGIQQTHRSVRVHVWVDRRRHPESAESLVYLGAKELRKVGVTVVERIPRVRRYRSGVRDAR